MAKQKKSQKKSNYTSYILFIGIVLLGSLVLWNILDTSGEAPSIVEEEGSVEVLTEAVDEVTETEVTEEGVEEPVEEPTEELIEEIVTEETATETEVIDEEESELVIEDEAKEALEERVTAVAARTDEIISELHTFVLDLDNTTLELTEEENDSLHESHQTYSDEVQITINEYLSELATLDSEINGLTQSAQDGFIEELSTISNQVTELHSEVRGSLFDSYTNLNLMATHEDDFDDEADFLVSSVLLDFIYEDNEDIILSIVIENAGTKDSDERFTYYSTFTINGEEVDTCRGQVEQIDAGQRTTMSCEIKIVSNAYDYYGQLRNPEDVLKLELIGSVDSNIELDELSEANNDFYWAMDLTISDFNEN